MTISILTLSQWHLTVLTLPQWMTSVHKLTGLRTTLCFWTDDFCIVLFLDCPEPLPPPAPLPFWLPRSDWNLKQKSEGLVDCGFKLILLWTKKTKKKNNVKPQRDEKLLHAQMPLEGVTRNALGQSVSPSLWPLPWLLIRNSYLLPSAPACLSCAQYSLNSPSRKAAYVY